MNPSCATANELLIHTIMRLDRLVTRLSGFGPRDDVQPLAVLHVIESLGSGGAERLLFTNLRHLDSDRIRSSVVTIFDRDSYWADAIRELSVDVYSLGCRGYTDIPRGISRLQRLLFELRPDLIHSHLWAADMIARCAGTLRRVPVVSSIHSSAHESDNWNDGAGVSAWKRRLSRAADRVTARLCCDRLIAVSDYVRRSAHDQLGFPLERIELLYNSIEVEPFGSASDQTLDLRSELQLPRDSRILLNVGRVSPQKGLIHAIHALRRILDRHPTAHLVSVGSAGDGKWMERLVAEARRQDVAGNVHFLGVRRDIADVLQQCDLFIMPSLFEGLPLALVEAMASKCPCVVTHIGALPELVTHGETGWLIPPSDPGAIADAVTMMLSKPELRLGLGEAASKLVQERFDAGPAAARLQALYESITMGVRAPTAGPLTSR